MRLALVVLSALLAGSATSDAQVKDPDIRMPVESPTEIQAQQKLKEGQKLMSEDSYEEAAKAFQAAIAVDPLLFMAHYGLGTAHMAKKEYAAAATAFEGARAAFNRRAELYAGRNFQNQAARESRIRLLKERIRNEPEFSGTQAAARQMQKQEMEAEVRSLEAGQENSGPAQPPPGLFLSLGSAYFRSGRLADAEREYRAAIAAQPKLGEPRSNLAVVLLLTGRPADALAELKAAEKNGFKPPAGLKADIEAAIAKGKAQ
jgi:tetratricopeptide (TPR) repeat protein